MSRPIRHGFGIIPPLEYPHGGAFALAIAMDTEIDLDEHTATVHLRARYGAAPRPVYLATESGTGLAKTGQTLAITLAPDLGDETDDSDLTLGDLQDQQDVTYRIDFRDGEEALVLRLQGTATFVPADSDWGDSPATVSVPQIDVTVAANGAVSVSVSVLTTGGATVDNAAVVAAIEEDAAAVRTALELGTAATTDASAYAAASHTQAISTITGLQDALDAKAAAASLGTAATKNSGEANGVASLGSDGKIPSAQLPAIAIVDYLGTAANEAAMLALTGQKGDWAQRTDLGTMWFITGDDPTQLSSWREMTYPTAPVSSVAGLTGSIGSGDLRTAMGLGTADTPTFAGLNSTADITATKYKGSAGSPTLECSGYGAAIIKGGVGTGATAFSILEFHDTAGTRIGYVYMEPGSGGMAFMNERNGKLLFGASGADRFIVHTSGGLFIGNVPTADPGTRSLGVQGDIKLGLGETTNVSRSISGWAGLADNEVGGDLVVKGGAGHGTGAQGDVEIQGTMVYLNGGAKMKQVAISALPSAASSEGWRYEVNDASGPTVGATVSSGGSAKCEVRSNGTSWIVLQVF